MTDMTASRLGQANGSGATDALFLKQFSGEVITRFRTVTKFLNWNMVRTLTSGKSAQFPVIGKNSAYYHTPGALIAGGAIKHAEQTINIDDLLISPVFIPRIDEAKNHYDVRAPYTDECGDALAQAYDAHVAQVGLLAARANHPISSITLPSRTIVNSAYRTDGDVLATGIFDAGVKLDTCNAPEMGRAAFLLPAQYALLVQTTKVINRDWGGAGAYSDGKVLKVDNTEIVKTNNLPQTDVDSGPTAYQGDFSDTAALVMQKGAVGTVKLLDLAVESEYKIEYQGTLIVAKYAMGHGIVRPESAVELAVA